ncbi:MAG: hypothetical protein PCFJNLEI_02061 [Verrucomicrobiae bacterium]|nr:hypothetical protein [Verrucomicrobiae bacterium]
MSTLTEIEAAVDALPPKQREALMRYLAESASQSPAARAAGTKDLAEFGGTVRLHEEPLVWQAAVRDEWR